MLFVQIWDIFLGIALYQGISIIKEELHNRFNLHESSWTWKKIYSYVQV